MDVTQSVELVHGSEHLADVEPSDLLLEHASIVQEGPEVTSRNILHRQVDVRGVLESIQQTHQPGCLCGGQDVTLDENVPDLAAHATISLSTERAIGSTYLVHLEQCPLAHLLERTDLPRIRLACEKDLAIASLADLSNDLELVDLELDAALAKEGAFTTAVGLEFLRVFRLGELPLRGVFVEARTPLLAGSDVPKEIEVVIEEIWSAQSDGDQTRGVMASGVDCGVERYAAVRHSHSWATVAFLRTSGLSRSSFSHSLKPCLRVVPAFAVSMRMSLSTVMPFAVAIRMSGTAMVRPLAVFICMSGNSE